MFYSGESNVPGAPGNLMASSRNIPVGQDPMLPMTQYQFNDWVKYNLDKNKPLRPRDAQPGPTGPQLPGFLNKGASLPGAPGNVAGMYGQLPAGFDNKFVS
jgi:hypothetical protein